jgi:hypothetical protein
MKYAQVYASCGDGYFSALRNVLLERRERTVERDRELLERIASEVERAGYVP